ncbi:UNVERIFIED_CONTAM: DNA-binding transcriptional regulator YhcF (GntR family) [Acetivibrio alkalicellulosi]
MDFDSIKIEFDTKQSIYTQIVKYFKIKIHLGNLVNNDEIPSRRVLAAKLGINPATVQKAYKQLEEEGIVVTMPNSKSVIALDDNTLDRIKNELTENEVRVFLKNVKETNLSFKDVIAILTELWDEK